MPKTKAALAALFFLLNALAAVFAFALITIFMFQAGLPLFEKIAVGEFLLGSRWAPDQGLYGILPMIAGTALVTLGALLLAVPLSLSCAVFLAEFAPARVAAVLRPAIELMAGIPSVVYGFYGMIVIIPLLRDLFGGSGFSVLAGSIILGIMILPTIASISEDAIRSVPRTYREASLALGAGHWQTVKKVIMPAARSGIAGSIALGLGRAMGETMAVVMITGNVPLVPGSPFEPVRTLTANVVLEMGYATGTHQQALFATGMVLFFAVIILNMSANYFIKGREAG